MRLSDGREVFCKLHEGLTEQARKRTLVLMHGGPGESCISFGLCLDSLRTLADVIETDQRGCGRSEEEPDEAKISVNQVLEDFEEIRRHYRLRDWIVWGHSFGGRLALDYARNYPESTKAVILENPAVDIQDGLHCILRGYESYFRSRGREEEAVRMGALKEEKDIVKCLDAVNAVADHDKQRFWSNHLLSEEAARLLDMSRLPIEQRLRCVSFFHRMKRDESFSRNGWELLKSLGCPILLLCGEKDRILDGQLLEVFQSSQKCGQIRHVSGCGHYIHLGNVDEMTAYVRNFLSAFCG